MPRTTVLPRTHARRSRGQGWTLTPSLSRRTRLRVRPVRTAAASPWPGASCAVAEGKETGTASLAAKRALPPARPTHTFVSQPRAPCSPPPMASTRGPPRSPPRRPYRGQPLHWPRRSLCARAHPRARRRTRAPHRFGSPALPPRPRRRWPRATVTTLVLRPFEPSSLGVSLWIPVLDSHPGAVGLAAREVTPRRHLSLLGISSST
jgi:hypothetical protein